MALINKISKTRFIAGINCPRFFPLFELYKKKEYATLSFTEDLQDLLTEENNQKKLDLLSQMYDDDLSEQSVDLIKKPDPQLEVMMPYYRKIETLSAIYAKHLFKKDVEFSFDTKDQKYFQASIKDYEFYCFLDGYQELDDSIHIIESKAITSKNIIEATFLENKEKHTIFLPSKNGILKTREALGMKVNDDYYKKIENIIDRNHKIGSYIYDLAYQRMVIEKSNTLKKEVKYFLAILNHEYVFDGTYINDEPDYLKDIEGDFLIKFVDVTDLTKYALKNINNDLDIVIDRLDRMTYIDNNEDLCPSKGKHKCMFHDICYKNIPKENSIFTLLQNHLGFKDSKGQKYMTKDLLKMNILKVTDVPYDWLTRPINQIQYMAVADNKTFINKERIKKILSSMKYPIYHLDFESFPCPLPRFKGESPYSQSVFQFNLHIEKENETVDLIKDSYHYLATDAKDHRKELVENLLSLINLDGTILAWNDNFEKARLKEFAKFFPEFKDKLSKMIDNTFDLMAVFKGNHHDIYSKWNIPKQEGINYYDQRLQGSYSIKKVLPIFVPEMSYSNLDVKNGTEAMVTYAQFQQMDEKTFIKNKEALIAYCRQDTFAMVKLLDSLRKIS